MDELTMTSSTPDTLTRYYYGNGTVVLGVTLHNGGTYTSPRHPFTLTR